jgi:flavodoxin I
MKIAIVYWSGTGNTEMMATMIAQGAEASKADVTLFQASDFDSTMINDFDRFAFGCPSMGSEVLEENEFEPMYSSVEGALSGKEVLLFGSYGWGDGQWMREWVERAHDMGINLVNPEGFMIHETPDQDGLDLCFEAGKQLGNQ